MALSDSFAKLWQDSRFRKRLTAVIVDEAHCIDDWGDESFRPAYRELHVLRAFTGMDVPFLACTATCRTKTFDLIWSTLGYGDRPFWGVDVGAGRSNLFHHVREQKHPKAPILEILDFLPSTLNVNTPAQDIPKMLLYFDSEADCRKATDYLRKCLPAELRQCVYAFSSDLSSEGKERLWELFRKGVIRVLCATDAAGMGCNVPDVTVVASFGVPRSLSALNQRVVSASLMI